MYGHTSIPSIGVAGVIAIGRTDGGVATAIAAIAAMATATTDTAGADRRVAVRRPSSPRLRRGRW